MRTKKVQIKFEVDSMLGRLAKWLRIIGCDVAYFNHIEDDRLIEYANETGRIILTKDTRLIKRRKIRRFFFVEGNDYKTQLKQVVTHFNIDIHKNLLDRCTICNKELQDINKDQVEGKVPVYVFNTVEKFSICNNCERIYYSATHKENILKELNEL